MAFFNTYCNMPYYGMTIHSNGDLGICCSQNREFNYGHISETEDLYDAWLEHDNILKLRYEDGEDRQKACGTCLKHKNLGIVNRWHEINRTEILLRKIPIDGKIRFLEFTTSNICNQACSSCSSFFSTKWIPIEKQALEMGLPLDEWKNQKGGGFNSFGHKQYRMSNEDVKKIIKILPDLHILYIKGGEPFADQLNFQILEELIKVNPQCRVMITSNVSKIPQKFINILKKISYVSISCSIDGINETYKYIRSTPFNKTIENIKRWHNSNINGHVNVSYNISMHNFYHTIDFLKWFNENLLEEVNTVKIQSWIPSPRYLAPVILLDESEIINNIEEIKKLKLPKERFKLDFLIQKKDAFNNKTPHEVELLKKRFRSYTHFMNFVRGIDIFDLHPQLKHV